MTDDEKYCIDRYGKRAIASYTWSPSGMKEFLFEDGSKRYVFPETFKLFMKGEGNVREEGCSRV